MVNNDRVRTIRPLLSLVTLFLGMTVHGCLTSEERTAVEVFRAQRHEVTVLIQDFLSAAAKRDTTALKRLSTDSIRVHVLEENSDAIRAARNTWRPVRLEIGRCNGRLDFTYKYGDSSRNGATEVRCRDDRWIITRFSLLVEYHSGS